MSISDAMLAQGLLEYFQQHAADFEDFLIQRFEMDGGYAIWSGDKANKQLILTIRTTGQGGEALAEREYAIKVETVRPPRGKA